MELNSNSLKLITFSVFFSFSTFAHSFTVLDSAWNPEKDTARHPTSSSTPAAPGGATWSIIGAGITDASGSDDHSGNSTTELDALNSSLDIPVIINDAFNLWANVSNFTNLGQVMDSGLGFGADERGGSFGDIRIGAIFIDPSTDIPNELAHAYAPGTQTTFSNGSIAGDIHIDNNNDWVNSIDLATVLLHEIGHTLGLDHSTVTGSIMFATYSGANFNLSADDIAGIQSIYGAPSIVPLPGAPILFLSAIGLVGFIRRKRITS